MARVRMIIIDIYPNSMPEAIGIMRGTHFFRPESVLSLLYPSEKFAEPLSEKPTLEATPEDINVLPSPFLHMSDSGYIVGEGSGLEVPALCPQKQR